MDLDFIMPSEEKKKSTIMPFMSLVIESNHDYKILWAFEVTINY